MKGKCVNLIKLWVFIASIVIVDAMSCPVNCRCYLDQTPRRVECSNQNLNEFPEEISELVEHLDLSNNNLYYIPADIERLDQLKIIDLSKNKLNGLPKAIENLKKLKILDLSNNFIENNGVDIVAIKRLPNLKLLYLRKNRVTSLENLINPELEALDVSQCAITQLTNSSLIGVPKLINLNLEGNPLESIENVISKNLRWLDLSNCKLNLLYPNTFENVPELEHLHMANNRKVVFSTREETLRHEKLKRLDVTGCNLDRPGIHGFPLLTHAKFSRNRIRILPNRIFSKNKMLTHLYLDKNALKDLNDNSFSGISKLEELDLSKNMIDTLPEMIFRDNINLRSVNLSYNHITNIPNNFLNTANTFDLSSNDIENISIDISIKMPRLKNFNLSNNRLEVFDSDLSSSTLKTLNLEGNRLVKLTNRSFANFPALSEIDLSGNRLTEGMDNNVFEYNFNLETILLHDNPWRCDCEQLYPIFGYLMRGPKTEASTLICQSPNSVSGYSWATACNKIWNFDDPKIPKSINAYSLVMMGLLITLFIFGSSISICHSIKTKKRQALLRLQEAERAEARERLIQHRRSREIEELRLQENNHVPRVHPEELIGPPTYEEAVEMPRLVRSLENLNSTTSIEGMGRSVQSLDHDAWARKRRMQTRKRVMSKRAKSEDNVGSRRNERIEKSIDINKNSNRKLEGRVRTVSKNSIRSKKNFVDPEEPTCSVENGSKRVTKPRTPNSLRRKRRLSIKHNGHSSDDEDSDVLRNSTVGARQSVLLDDVCVIDLPREPRGGSYRPSVVRLVPSSSELASSPEPCDGTAVKLYICESEIV